MILKYTATVALIAALSNTSYAKEDHEQHEAHEHGHAQLNIAQEGNSVTMQFISPAMNIVGFEHQPNTEAQEEKIKQAIKQLEKGSALFSFPKQAQCKLESASAETSLLDEHHDDHKEDKHHDDDHHEEAKSAHKDEHDKKDEHHDDEHSEDSHSDFEVAYNFTCKQPKQLHQLQVRLFETFTGIEEIRTQYISDKGQQGYELTSKVWVINLP